MMPLLSGGLKQPTESLSANSGYLSYINEALASLWHLSPADTASLTTQNAHRLFRIKP